MCAFCKYVYISTHIKTYRHKSGVFDKILLKTKEDEEKKMSKNKKYLHQNAAFLSAGAAGERMSQTN